MASDSSSEGAALDPLRYSMMSMEEKRNLVYEISDQPHASELLQSWSRQEILEILCAEMGKERKYTGLTKLKIIENLLKIVGEKKSGSTEDVADLDSQSSPCLSPKITKRQRKIDQPARLPVPVNHIPISNTKMDSNIAVYCRNSACKATLNQDVKFCKRCSCCICYQYDDNKDPSLWLSCCSDPPFQDTSCGMSCHLECALKHEKCGISRGKQTGIEGTFCCASCGKVNDLHGCLRKQLMKAKETRRVDILCYRISLSKKLLSEGEKYQDVHQIVDEAVKKLEAEVGPLTGVPVGTGRGIVNRLSSGPEVQKLCSLAIDTLDSLLSTNILHQLPSSIIQDTDLVATNFLRFEDVDATYVMVVVGTEDVSSGETVGYRLWHRKACEIDYPIEPTCTLSQSNLRFVVRGLTPSSEYYFKAISFDGTGDLGTCEVQVSTAIPREDDTSFLAIERSQSPITNFSELSNPSSVEDETNNVMPCSDQTDSRTESYLSYCKDSNKIVITNLSEDRITCTDVGGGGTAKDSVSLLDEEHITRKSSMLPDPNVSKLEDRHSSEVHIIEGTSMRFPLSYSYRFEPKTIFGAMASASSLSATLSLYLFGVLLLFASAALCLAHPQTHRHQFIIQATPVKRLCKTHNAITVNGQFPGPTLEVSNGDTLIVTVINKAKYNVTIHWHGIRQLRTGWADGPEFVTQCPIRPGGSYTYRFTIQGQEGTLWWHAHSSWLRATVYGALIIRPREGDSYPFPKPNRESTLLMGEWWDANPIDVVRQATRTGAAPNVSDAYTFNGQPGDLYKCSSKDTVIVPIDSGETNLLRVVNSALNQALFFTVANHKLTVVGADASYTKPFTTSVLMLGPGQTTDVLISGNQAPARYYIAARAYQSAQNAPFGNTTTTAILDYKSAPCPAKKGAPSIKPIMPFLPAFNDTATVTAFSRKFRSPRPVPVPTKVDENLFFTVGLGLNNCPRNFKSSQCQGPNGTRFTASMNNVSFVLPSNISILQAFQQGIPGVVTPDFPANPPVKFDYTGNVSRSLFQPVPGTKGYRLKYGSTVQVVLQDTSIVTPENHPIHLHGYDFYIIAEGFGNFNPKTDTKKFNLVDPPLRNTVAVPVNGWAVIRFVADNPGAWLMHCHLDVHITWGLAMVFLVDNGVGQLQSIEAPPPDLPIC